MVKLSKDEIIDTLGKCLLNVTCPCEQDGCYLANHHDCREQLFDNVVAMLKENEWNRLTEDADGIVHGLPGDDGTYLMTDGEDIWIDDYVDGVDDGVWLDSGRDIREIKAWMYMPELPK